MTLFKLNEDINIALCLLFILDKRSVYTYFLDMKSFLKMCSMFQKP